MSDALSTRSMSGSNTPSTGSPESVFPNVPTLTATAMKKAFRYFKKAMTMSGASLTEVTEQPTEEPSGAEVYFDDSNCDERLRGLTHEQSLARSKSIFLEDTAEAIRRSLHDTMSLGEVEMSEIIGSMNLGDSQRYDGEISEGMAGSSSGASSSGASSSGALSTGASSSYGIV
ncbi:hypothetical protein BSKO_13477 [Bryopsis sp. KO-2023]|nr:hypothetical protein BSKO_13477 [Bryopsis sp. KO-2023]